MSRPQNRITPHVEPVEKWAAQLRRGCLELAILASVWDGQRYGLEILRSLAQHPSLVVAEGTIYPILNRLQRGGQVTSKWVDRGTGHPRKYYRLTGAGRSHTKRMTRRWSAFAGELNALLSTVTGASR